MLYSEKKRMCQGGFLMKIEKKIVSDKTSLSYKTKTGIATLLGMSAVFMSACGDDNSVNGQILGPTQDPSSNDSSTDPQNTSSSSAIDIPLSHEAISSSVFEELSSSATQPSKTSSSSYISSGASSASRPVPNSSSVAEPSSSAVTPTSSAAETTSSATEPISSAVEPVTSATVPTSSAAEPGSSANETTSSSSIETPASSSSAQSPYGDCAPDDPKCIDDWRCQHNDPLCPQIYMCDDPKDPRCMMVSMVSTYDRSDIS